MLCWIQYKECYKETVNSSLVFGDTALLPLTFPFPVNVSSSTSFTCSSNNHNLKGC